MKENIVDVFDSWLGARLRNVHTMLPGKIETYYGHTKRKARIKILVTLKDVKGNELEIPPIDNVPVIFPGSKEFSLLFPLKKGDGCMIVFSEEGIGSFLKGETTVASDSLARFSLTDAVCMPGLWSFKNIPDSEKSTIIIDDDGNVELNGGGKRLVTHAELDTALQTFMLALNAHIHTGVTTGPGSSGPPAPMTLDISSSKTETIRTDG